MIVEDVITGSRILHECKPDHIISCLLKMEKIREKKILSLQDRMKKYELKLAQQQAAYHRMSAFRRLITGRPPDNHLAVEHLVYIKQPLHEIEKLNMEISYLRKSVTKVKEGAEILSIRLPFTQELELLYTEGWSVDE